MKSFALALGMSLLALTGCAGGNKVRTADEAFAAMSRELAQTIDGERGTDAREAVGATMVTSAVVPVEPAEATIDPMQLPDERMPVSEAPPGIMDTELMLSSRH